MTETGTVRDPPIWFEIERGAAIPSAPQLPTVALAHETLPGSPDPAPPAASPVESGLRLLTDRLDVPAALLFASAPGGELRLVSAVGTWGGDALALRGLAETLAGEIDVLDVTDAIEGARFAAGARLGHHEGALLVLDSEGRTPDDAWNRAFADAAQTALALVRSQAGGGDVTRVLHEIAVHPGRFDERLALALVRLADAVGLDGAAYARADGGQWVPEARFDPSEHLIPSRPVPLRETFCAFTTQTDGPFAVQDAAASPIPLSEPGAYLGAPVFVGGKCVGTLSAAGHRARARPFRDDDLALVEALARWIGSAVGGRDTARRLAEREADLSAFFNAAPMGMGLAQVVETDAGADLQIDAINRAGALMMGGEPEALVGTLASQGRLRGFLDRWLDACRTAHAARQPHRFEVEIDGRDGRRTLATTVARTNDDDAATRFLFVTEDTTDARRADDRLREREAHIDALVSLAPVALFATDRAGRLSMSRGRGLDLLGLSIDRALGRPVQDVFGAADAAGHIAAALGGGRGAWAGDGGRPLVPDPGPVPPRRPRPPGRADRRGARRDGRGGGGLGRQGPDGQDADRAAQAPRPRDPLAADLDPGLRRLALGGHPARRGGRGARRHRPLGRAPAERPGRLAGPDAARRRPDRAPPRPRRRRARWWPRSPRAAGPPPRPGGWRSTCGARCPKGLLLLDRRLFGRVVRHLIGGAVASAPGTRVDVRLTAHGPDEMELSVLGGVPTGGLGIGPGLIHRLVRAMGGTAQEVAGDDGGWVLRLPRHSVPVVEMPQADGWTGRAPELAGDGR